MLTDLARPSLCRRRDEEKGALIDGVRQDIQNHDLEQKDKHKRLKEGEDKARQLDQQVRPGSSDTLPVYRHALRRLRLRIPRCALSSNRQGRSANMTGLSSHAASEKEGQGLSLQGLLVWYVLLAARTLMLQGANGSSFEF